MKTMLMFAALLSSLLPGKVSAGSPADVSFPQMKGWKLTVSPDVYTPENLWDLINGAAESYLSYDFIDLHLADYENREGTVIHVEIYRHNSLDDAFGIYASERSSDYAFLDVGTQGYLDEGVLNYFAGPYYIKLYSTRSSEDVQESLKSVALAVSGHLVQEYEWPGLLAAFPSDGKLANEDHFVRENFIGLNFLHSAFTVEYEGGYRLFLIRGRDREEILEMARSYLRFTKQDIDPVQEPSFVVRDRYNGEIPLKLRGSYLAGILDGAGNARAMENLQSLVNNLPD